MKEMSPQSITRILDSALRPAGVKDDQGYNAQLPGRSPKKPDPCSFTIAYKGKELAVKVSTFDMPETVAVIDSVYRVQRRKEKKWIHFGDESEKEYTLQYLSIEGTTEGIVIIIQICVVEDGVTPFILYNA